MPTTNIFVLGLGCQGGELGIFEGLDNIAELSRNPPIVYKCNESVRKMLAGIGRSVCHLSQVKESRFVDDVYQTTLSATEAGPVTLMGHSYGGLVVSLVAERFAREGQAPPGLRFVTL